MVDLEVVVTGVSDVVSTWYGGCGLGLVSVLILDLSWYLDLGHDLELDLDRDLDCDLDRDLDRDLDLDCDV